MRNLLSTDNAKPLALLAAALLCGCSNKEIYEAVQRSNAMECEQNVESAREDCLSRIDESYESYERTLKDVDNPRR